MSRKGQYKPLILDTMYTREEPKSRQQLSQAQPQDSRNYSDRTAFSNNTVNNYHVNNNTVSNKTFNSNLGNSNRVNDNRVNYKVNNNNTVNSNTQNTDSKQKSTSNQTQSPPTTVPAPFQHTKQPSAKEQSEMLKAVTSAITFDVLKRKWSKFQQLDKTKQRNILGEFLYPKVKDRTGSELAPRITGMLVDLDAVEVDDVCEMIEQPEVLEERIREAKRLIMA